MSEHQPMISSSHHHSSGTDGHLSHSSVHHSSSKGRRSKQSSGGHSSSKSSASKKHSSSKSEKNLLKKKEITEICAEDLTLAKELLKKLFFGLCLLTIVLGIAALIFQYRNSDYIGPVIIEAVFLCLIVFYGGKGLYRICRKIIHLKSLIQFQEKRIDSFKETLASMDQKNERLKKILRKRRHRRKSASQSSSASSSAEDNYRHSTGLP